MNYLAIAKETNMIAFAVFEDKKLKFFDKKFFYEYDEMTRHRDWHDHIVKMLQDYNIGVVVTHKVDEKRLLKSQLKNVWQIKAIIQIACLTQRVSFLEVSTTGWEKYITDGRPTAKKKISLINKGYGLDLKLDVKKPHQDDRHIADAIILGEAIAHKRLHER